MPDDDSGKESSPIKTAPEQVALLVPGHFDIVTGAKNKLTSIVLTGQLMFHLYSLRQHRTEIAVQICKYMRCKAVRRSLCGVALMSFLFCLIY